VNGSRFVFPSSFHGPVHEQELVGRLARDVHLREHLDLLRLAVFEDDEIVGLEVLDEFAFVVGDDRVDLDVVDLGLEDDRGLARACGGAGWAWEPALGAAGPICCADGPAASSVDTRRVTESARRISKLNRS